MPILYLSACSCHKEAQTEQSWREERTAVHSNGAMLLPSATPLLCGRAKIC